MWKAIVYPNGDEHTICREFRWRWRAVRFLKRFPNHSRTLRLKTKYTAKGEGP